MDSVSDGYLGKLSCNAEELNWTLDGIVDRVVTSGSQGPEFESH